MTVKTDPRCLRGARGGNYPLQVVQKTNDISGSAVGQKRKWIRCFESDGE